MKSRATLVFTLLVLGVASVGGAVWMVQRQQTIALEGGLSLMRQETRELDRLREENRRLKQEQIPPEELERLRADHAALPRLRAEGEALRKAAL
jgi:hypothetical protein